MKKGIFTLFILFLVSGLYAQEDCMNSKSVDWEWAPVGAVWMYSDTGFGYETYYFVRSEKDTVFMGKDCKKLKLEKYEESSSLVLDVDYRYTYQEGGKIYMYSFGEGEFQQLYDYTATEGDTIRVNCPLAPQNCYADFVVDSVVERMPGGWPSTTYPVCETNTKIKTFHLDLFYHSGGEGCGVLTPNNSPVGHYVSFAGAVASDMCDVYEGGTNSRVFNCYYDGNVNIFRSRNDSCIAYYQEHLDILQNHVNSKIDVYPNPVKETLTIINSSLPKLETINVEIYSITGLKLLSKYFIETTEINVSNYSAGIYFILIKQNDKIIHKEKIIVE